MFQKALEIARKAHKGQMRKYGGKDYISHPMAVAEALEDQDAKVVALLHDVVEDTDVTLEDLGVEFPRRIVGAVNFLSRKVGESYVMFIRRVAKYPLARRVKIADIRHNLSSLPEEHSLVNRYQKALGFLERSSENEGP